MNSTSISDEAIVTVSDLDIIYDYDFYRSFNLRDKFISLIKDPMSQIFSNKNTHQVLKDINFSIKKGERVGILGVNGAGKTSLCRAICKMYYPSKGSINVQGETRAIFDTSVGVIGQLTGRENATLISHFLFPNFDTATRLSYVNDAIEFSELGEFIDVPFQSYSKGMQARLCLSLISCKESDLLIMDEVFDGADEFFQRKITKRVLNMIDKSGAVIFVSHSPDQIRQSCNRVFVINNKSLAYDGDVEGGIAFYQSLQTK